MQCRDEVKDIVEDAIEFQSPDGEIGNAVLSLSFRMEYWVHRAFFKLRQFFKFLPTRVQNSLKKPC